MRGKPQIALSHSTRNALYLIAGSGGCVRVPVWIRGDEIHYGGMISINKNLRGKRYEGWTKIHPAYIVRVYPKALKK